MSRKNEQGALNNDVTAPLGPPVSIKPSEDNNISISSMNQANTVVSHEKIPQELKNLNQWVCWRYELDKKGKPTKVPYNPKSRKKASSTDPRTWVTFDVALAAVCSGRYPGIGFVFTENDPYCGIDLDHFFDKQANKITDENAAYIFKHLNSYTEESPSGEGRGGN